MIRMTFDQAEIDRVMLSYVTHQLHFPVNQIEHIKDGGIVVWQEPEMVASRSRWRSWWSRLLTITNWRPA